MDRRDFLRFLLASPLASSLLSIPRLEEAGSALYLIADNPQDSLPSILAELEKRGIIHGRPFAFRGPHPLAKELRACLLRDGWEEAGRTASLSLTLAFQPLLQSAAPSFTLVKNGHIRDLRTRELGTLWQEMNRRNSASSCLTIASFMRPTPFPAPGRSATVFVDGHKHETLSLKKNQVRRYRTLNGEIRIRIEDGKAEVLASSCRHKICQSSAPAFRAGERIVCAPNHFLLTIDGPRFIDTVTG
ncbi:MAG: NusG domain II-containing protein [Candidatus Aminicenantes bacterium]|nr:NusG domain II-containing protein [Candidatus Aminicenantes bacterium]